MQLLENKSGHSAFSLLAGVTNHQIIRWKIDIFRNQQETAHLKAFHFSKYDLIFLFQMASAPYTPTESLVSLL